MQIQEMARMTPGQRLELLKEVGGTRVYEERRKESIKIMGETEARRTQVRSKSDWLVLWSVLRGT
jgi:structural maintenance of chromosome 3 (chondroitin sulfate proteoglycan 6)